MLLAGFCRLCRHSGVESRRFWARYNSTGTGLPPFPPFSEWRKEFPDVPTRVYVRDSTVADRLAKSFFKRQDGSSSEPIASENDDDDDGKVIIEAFPGPGVLTRSLLKLPKSKLKKLIVLENGENYLKYLQPLEALDPRVTVVPLDGYQWVTYREIEEKGLLDDVVKREWTDKPPNLHFIAQIPNSTLGDQLINQLIRLIPERSWLFKYGRMPMSLLLNDTFWAKIIAEPGSKERSKLGIIASGTADLELSLPPRILEPYAQYFYPQPGVRNERIIKNYKVGTPIVSANIYPLKDPMIKQGMLDKWDYVLRRLLILKANPVTKAIGSLAPGATNLLKTLSDPSLLPDERIDVQKSPRRLTLKEWSIVVKAFDEWPFAPEDLHIADFSYRDIEKGKRK